MSEPVSYERLMEIAKKSILAHAYDLQYCRDQDVLTWGSWEDALNDVLAWAAELGLTEDEVTAEYRTDFPPPAPRLSVKNAEGVCIFEGDFIRSTDPARTFLMTSIGGTTCAFSGMDEFEVNLVYDEYVSLRHVDTDCKFVYVDPDNFSPVCEFCDGDGMLSEPLRVCDECDGEGIVRKGTK